MSAIVLATRGVVKRYGRRRALDGLTLAVPRGAVMGLVGPNGAGKTTWMMVVAGLARANGGEIDILGAGPFDAAVHSGRLSILPQDSELPLDVTPRALLYRLARLQGIAAADARRGAEELLAAVNLCDRADDPVRALSHGMRKRLMTAQCFVGRPDIVLLDEPLNGLDPVEADRVRRFILSRRGEQTVVVSSHNLADIERMCTHAAFIEKGRTVRMDTLRALTADGAATLEDVYLGRAAPAREAREARAERPDAAARLVELLRAGGLTCATAESCTGGGAGAAITAVPGSSDVYLGGVVSYANAVKRDVLGVPAEILETAGAVSGACAEKMAEGARRLTGADVAVSVTGIAGPGGATAEKPVGLVWFGLATADGTRSEKALFAGDRAEVRRQAVLHALGMLTVAAMRP